jgi:hypothetical protein
MKDQRAKSTPNPGSYEAPRVERVLTPAELEQEIVYAGQDLSADSG